MMNSKNGSAQQAVWRKRGLKCFGLKGSAVVPPAFAKPRGVVCKPTDGMAEFTVKKYYKMNKVSIIYK